MFVSKGRLKKFWRLRIQRNGHAIKMYIWDTPKYHILLTLFAINGLSLELLSSLMFMTDTRMEGAGINSSKGVLIPCCHRNSNPSSIFTMKLKRNVARKNLLPFIPNPIMHPHFSYPFSKKELTAWERLQKKPCFQYLCPRMKTCSGAVLTKKTLLRY